MMGSLKIVQTVYRLVKLATQRIRLVPLVFKDFI